MSRVTIRPQILHSSPRTKKFKCDGKSCFEVLQRQKKFTLEERYWCDYYHSYFDPSDFKCPKENEQ